MANVQRLLISWPGVLGFHNDIDGQGARILGG